MNVVKKIMLLLSAGLLFGCVAVMVAGTAASMAVYDQRSLQTIEKDSRISQPPPPRL